MTFACNGLARYRSRVRGIVEYPDWRGAILYEIVSSRLWYFHRDRLLDVD